MCHRTRGHNVWEKDKQLMFTKTTTMIHPRTAHLGSRLILYAVSLTASTTRLMQGAYLWRERFGFQMITTRWGPKWRLNRHAVRNTYAHHHYRIPEGIRNKNIVTGWAIVPWVLAQGTFQLERMTHDETPGAVPGRIEMAELQTHEIHTLEYQKLTVQNISWVQTAIEGMYTYQALFCRIFRRASFALNPH